EKPPRRTLSAPSEAHCYFGLQSRIVNGACASHAANCLHFSGADVGELAGGVVGVEEGFDHAVEFALSGKDDVNGVTPCALASRVGRDVVRGGFDLRA